MNRKIEKVKRSLTKKELKNLEREEFLNSLPISLITLQKLFDRLDSKLSEENCDDSFKFTLEFIQSYQLPENELIEWFKNNGGYCDCEILANVEEQINDK